MAEILRHHGTEYLEKYDKHILPSHKKAMRHIVSCRTREMGGQKYLCKACNKFHYSYHSCRDRHCPKCQNDRIDQWLEKQFELLLPVPYFMATITVPQWLRSVFRSHQKKMYHLFFKASAEAIMLLARDKRFLGAQIGLMGILQTWTKMLAYHPHLHFLIPGGGMKGDVWKYARPNLLVHVKPLSRLIRRLFEEYLQNTDLYKLVPQSAWKQDWVCHIKPVGNGQAVLKYLAPYVYRVALSDWNILHVNNDRVTFQYRDREDKTFKTCTLEVLEFLRRFLQHVLPKGFVKVRYFGVLATKKRAGLDFIKERIGKRLSLKSRAYPTKPQKVMTCPECGQVLLFICEIPKLRGPP
ncbi:transposase [bacterium]